MKTIKITENVIIRYINRSIDIQDAETYIESNLVEPMSFITLPLPDVDSLFGPIQTLTTKPTKIKFDVNLFQALCIRNLTGNVSYRALKDYGLGFSLRRFTVLTNVVHETNIQYDQLDAHVILCMIAMIKANYE